MVRDFRGQAAFWRGELRRRTVNGVVNRLVPEIGLLAQQALERRSAPPMAEFAWGYPLFPTVAAATGVAAGHRLFEYTTRPPTIRRVGHYWPDIGVHRLEGVVVDRMTGLVFAGRQVVAASANDGRDARTRAFVSGSGMRLASTDRPQHLAGPIIPVGAPDNYFHFLTDTGPRAWAAGRAHPDSTVMFSGPPAPYATELLALVEMRWGVFDDLGPAVCDGVVLVDPSPPSWPHPDLLTSFRDVILGAVDSTVRGSGRWVYVSRAASDRRLAGEELLETELASRGFACVRLEGMTVVEQVNLMRGADLVVAPHGAGLANVVFMRPGTRVVELTTGDWWMPAFRNLSAMLGIHHHLVVLPRSDEEPHGRAVDAVPLVRRLMDGLTDGPTP